MQEATFDIWAGTSHKSGKWLETVTGIDNARKRMREIATEAPGPYFIFGPWNGYILDEIDTQGDALVAPDRQVVAAR